MIKHQFLIILRNFKKYKRSFVINLVGLSSGLTCVLLIYFWVNDELKMDRFHPNNDRLYQVMNNLRNAQNILTLDVTPVPLGAALLSEMPEVEQAVSVNDFFSWRNREGILSDGDKHIKVKGLHASKDFFNVFAHPLIQGNKDHVLSDKINVVISEDLARRMWNTSENVIGRTLDWKHSSFEGSYNVSGVFARHANSSMPEFDIIFSIDVLLEKDRWAKEWTGNYCRTYVVLKDGTDVDRFNERIADFPVRHNARLDEFTLFVQQYSEWYMHGNYENGVPAGGRIVYVRLFSIIALFILLIACINFMNLSTAQASRRMKEIGVKKAFGIKRGMLVAQYLLESMVTALLALTLAFVLAVLFLPQFNEITGKHLQLDLDTSIVLSLLGFALFTGFVSGCYPAIYLSGFNPITVLKGKLSASTGELWVRKGLVVIQYTLSVVFIVVFLVVNAQIRFAQTKDLGYSRDNILCFQWKENSPERFHSFMSALKNTPAVVNATNMSGNILDDVYGIGNVSWRGQDADRDYEFKSPVVGYDFIETLGMEIIEGRSFSADHANEMNSIIINEAARDMMGLEDVAGRSILMSDEEKSIIGVVKNFNYGSLHNTIEPLIFRLDPFGKNIMVKIKGGTEQAAIKEVKDVVERFQPLYPFEFTFMEDNYRALYDPENRLVALSKIFTGIAIIISCLGLFGLAAFAIQKRFKEICIRKVHGSSVLNMVLLLSGDFMRPILLSIFIALPLSHLVTALWLEGFAYRIDLQWWFFASAGTAALLIAWLTVVSQTMKASTINPMKGLREE